MSFKPEGVGGVPFPIPHGEKEQVVPQVRYKLCRNFGLTYPPNPCEACSTLVKLKQLAEEEISQGNLEKACLHYSNALKITAMFPMETFGSEYYINLLSNRLLLYMRMKEYHAAEEDAKTWISKFPEDKKAYRRAYEAAKEATDGAPRAVEFLLQGLSLSRTVDLDLLTEICLLITEASTDQGELPSFEKYKVPQADDDVWIEVLRKLNNKDAWESISMLITGIHRGPATPLQGIGHGWPCIMLNVGSLMYHTPDDLLKQWGFQLAIHLLGHGANIDDISVKFRQPALLVVLEISLRTGTLELLEAVLNMCRDDIEQLNATNQSGQTVLHGIALACRNITPTLFLDTLDLLLRYNVEASLPDDNGKWAKDFIDPTDPGYQKFLDADKTVEVLTGDTEQFRKLDNIASKDSQDQYFSQFNNHAYQRYLLLGKKHCSLGAVKHGFQNYMKGFMLPEVTREMKIISLEAGVLLLKDLPDRDLDQCYEQLKMVDHKLWPTILTNISNAAEWRCLAYLLFGTDLSESRFGMISTESSVKKFLIGVAGAAPTEAVNVSTVFAYLKTTPPSTCSHWLDAAVLAVHLHGNEHTLQTLREDEKDTLISAVTRFALLTGRLTILNVTKAMTSADEMTGSGDSVFHVVTKMRPVPDSSLIYAVTNMLFERGYSILVRDAAGMLPSKFLENRDNGDQVFQLYKKLSYAQLVSKLKIIADQLLIDGQIKEAVEKYTKAIKIIEKQQDHTLTEYKNAELYANRAECFFKLKQYKPGKKDAEQSLKQDPNLYKATVILGRCLCKMNRFDKALKSLVAGYNRLDLTVEDETKIDILKELCFAARKINRIGELQRKLQVFPENHLWILTTYKLIVRKDWNTARETFSFAKRDDSRPCQLSETLQPICDIKQLKANPWALDVIEFLLSSGADKKTLSLEPGDTYLHAVVRITLVVVSESTDRFQLLVNLLGQCSTCGSSDVHHVDANGNTLLHTAATEHQASKEKQHRMIKLLLQHGVDPRLQNSAGERAIDLLPRSGSVCHETLMMAKYSPDLTTQQHEEEQYSNGCEECNQLLEESFACLNKDQVNAGYEKLFDLMMKKHTSVQHEALVNKAVFTITKTLAKSRIPEIPNFLTMIPQHLFIAIIEKLIEHNLWRQLDPLVRKYHATYGSDNLRRFASKISILPLLRDVSLQCLEDLKLQIMNNLLKSGAKFGRDDSETAFKMCQECGHYKVLTALVQLGADTTKLSFERGDTPIHAAVTIVLEKTKDLTLLEVLLKKHEDDPESNRHLSPHQLDSNGDCLFHLVARTKCSKIALQVTELLCKHELSSQYYNKVGLMPIYHISNETDMRWKFLQSAAKIKPKLKTSPNVLSEMKNRKRKDVCDKIKGRNDKTVEKDARIECKKVISGRDQLRNSIEILIKELHYNAVPIFSSQSKGKELDGTTKTNSVTVAGTYTKTETTANTKAETKAKQEIVTVTKTQTEKEYKVVVEVEDQTHVEYAAKGKAETDASIYCVAQAEVTANTKAKLDENKEDEEAAKGNPLAQAITNHNTEARANALKVAGQETKLEDEPVVESNIADVIDGNKIEVQVSSTIMDNKDSHGNQANVIEAAVGENIVAVVESGDECEGENAIEIDAKIFDNLEWEVECTADVLKTLRDKHVQPELKARIIRKIQCLASGDWQPVLCKKLTNTPPELKLFAAKLSKGARILWELAVAFSPRCSESPDRRLKYGNSSYLVQQGHIYSEIIRVWDIVLDHNKLNRSVELIKKCHKRGEKCVIRKTLQGINSDHTCHDSAKCYPRLFVDEHKSLEMEENKMQYFPPASANDTEFHILKFYTFSSALVSHVLQNIDTKVDFPFRVTDLEHDIINLPSRAPILLLGRSGTGKTTCCLYRLWSQFYKYWNAASEAKDPLLPRCEFIYRDLETHRKETDVDHGAEKIVEVSEGDSDEKLMGGAGGGVCEAENASCNFDHIHQVFITKNAVLCSSVKKNFRQLYHADDLFNQHVQNEIDVLPSRLQDIGEYSFPLFITAKQLLLLLDASIEPPHFFERKEDGSLKCQIDGWTDTEESLRVLALLDEGLSSKNEAENVGQARAYDETAGVNVLKRPLQTNPRSEITYDVFAEEIWPKIKHHQNGYHPSLVWTEIMSFIKGSYEALSKENGYLEKEDYISIGRKRAPNFTGDRETVYKLFKKYELFKRQHRLFDVTDLVYNVYTRLATRRFQPLPWVIHQIYVDETQDFTQAELSLLVRLCQNPNDMFLTGDTAQGIMRGISFRFSDLRSLFHHAKDSMLAVGETSAIEVPKQIFQLTHNYRSHTGILSLATSILELLVEFFPESFDRLQSDQGLFPGPQPILLESCNFEDLAILLRGNKRSAPRIEFGEHQAILVANDATRDAIPEELRLGLVLTIYESKGLEFDDVLLYNFFKDSQANKEWRVVTDFLERLSADKHEKMQSDRDSQDSLQVLDEDILRHKDRSRPLTFVPNLHKVLNSELKQLYTALTRARVNVWIYDEDEEKRKPMFEYFKARKLVKSLNVAESNDEASLKQVMFVEKSSAADWCRRGDEFMGHRLYRVAAKCFKMGHDENKKKNAIAHEQALKASRLTKSMMRDEFLRASQLFLECGQPNQAVICLENAEEWELSAKLNEQLGKLDKAAQFYRRADHPIESSRCYELFGNFKKSLEVLGDNHLYNHAKKTLRRYQRLVSDLAGGNNPISEEYQIDMNVAEESLWHRAAAYFCKRNKSKMLEVVANFKSVDDQVRFLTEKGYVEDAADTLDNAKRPNEASELLLHHGKYERAIYFAGKTLQDDFFGLVILMSSRVVCRVLLKTTEQSSPVNFQLLEYLREAQHIFDLSKDRDKLGEVYMFIGIITNNTEDLDRARTTFLKTKNIAGLVEVTHALMAAGFSQNLKVISKNIDYTFNVCEILAKQSPSPTESEQKMCFLYGLATHSKNEVVVCPTENPLCLAMEKNKVANQSTKEAFKKVYDKSEVYTQIIIFLLSRTQLLLTKLTETRKRPHICTSYSSGMPHDPREGTPCPKLHCQQTKTDFWKRLEIDKTIVKVEANVLKIKELLKEHCKFTTVYRKAKEIQLANKFEACNLVWTDLLPAIGYNTTIAANSCSILKSFVEDPMVQTHFGEFLYEIAGKEMKCVAHIFFNALKSLCRAKPDPYNAVKLFKTFVEEADKKQPNPCFPQYLIWMEFFITLAILIEARLMTETSHDLSFILPSSLLAQQHFVSATISCRLTTFQMVGLLKFEDLHKAQKDVADILIYLVEAVSDEGLKHLKNFSKGDQNVSSVLERYVILILLLLCNVGKAVPTTCEKKLVCVVTDSKISKDLLDAFEPIRDLATNCVVDVASIIKRLFEYRHRDEKLLLCRWAKGNEELLTSELSFTETFSNHTFSHNIVIREDRGPTNAETGKK